MNPGTARRTPELGDPVVVLPGLGPARAACLAAARLRTVRDLLARLPTAYREPARAARAEDLEAAARGVVAGPGSGRLRLRARVLSTSLWPPGGPRAVLTVRLRAELAPAVRLRALYFGQPYLRKSFPEGRELELEGAFTARQGVCLLAPSLVDHGAPPERPRPSYEEVSGVPAATLRRAVRAALPALAAWPEPLAAERLMALDLPTVGEALRLLHDPASAADVERGRRRLALAEILALEGAHRDARRIAAASPVRAIAPEVWSRIRARLPFTLRAEQEEALDAMRADLARGARLQRLLHGEVGSGKTAVAFALALAIAADGGQAALLAPTEILARQHLARFRDWLRGARLEVLGLLGDDPPEGRAATLARLAAARPLLVVGTHALVSPAVRFADLRLVIFDEQHRFGVRQKAALLAKGAAPHVLTMTATPIPRTLAWARHGALDPLALRARAGSVAPVETRVRPAAEWAGAAAELRAALQRGARAFFVAPRIDGAGGLLERVAELRAGAWRGLPIEVVHGRMRGAAVQEALDRFAGGNAVALCGTTVVEVGLDVPGVEHMLVVGAERLGLASLHQLRGRLARGAGARPGRFQVFAEGGGRARLALLESCADGFRIADADLAARGPGTLRGVRQHGAGGFRLFEPARDADLVAWVRAQDWETGRADPD